jgi:hypothetical protein
MHALHPNHPTGVTRLVTESNEALESIDRSDALLSHECCIDLYSPHPAAKHTPIARFEVDPGRFLTHGDANSF